MSQGLESASRSCAKRVYPMVTRNKNSTNYDGLAAIGPLRRKWHPMQSPNGKEANRVNLPRKTPKAPCQQPQNQRKINRKLSQPNHPKETEINKKGGTNPATPSSRGDMGGGRRHVANNEQQNRPDPGATSTNHRRTPRTGG